MRIPWTTLGKTHKHNENHYSADYLRDCHVNETTTFYTLVMFNNFGGSDMSTMSCLREAHIYSMNVKKKAHKFIAPKMHIAESHTGGGAIS